MLTVALRNALAALKDRKGVSTLEYGVLAIVVLGAVVGVGALMTTNITSAFSGISGAITSATGG